MEITKAEFEKYYIRKAWSTKQTARHFKITHKKLREWMEQNGYELRTPAQSRAARKRREKERWLRSTRSTKMRVGHIDSMDDYLAGREEVKWND